MDHYRLAHLLIGDQRFEPPDPNSGRARGVYDIRRLMATSRGGLVEISVRCWDHQPAHQPQYRLTWSFDHDISRLGKGEKFILRRQAKRVDAMTKECPSGNWRPYGEAGTYDGIGTALTSKLNLPNRNPFIRMVTGVPGRILPEREDYDPPDKVYAEENAFEIPADTNEAWDQVFVGFEVMAGEPAAVYVFRAVYEGDSKDPPVDVSLGGGATPLNEYPPDMTSTLSGSGGANTQGTGPGTQQGETGSNAQGGGTSTQSTGTGTTTQSGGSGTSAGNPGVGGGGGSMTTQSGNSGNPVANGTQSLPGGTKPSSGGSDSKIPGADPQTEGGGLPPEGSLTGLTLLAEKLTVVSGQTVNVPVWLYNGKGLVDMNFNVEYDGTVARASGEAVRGNLLSGADFEANTSLSNTVKVGFVPTAGGVTAAKGTVCQIPFQGVGKPGTRTPLKIVARKSLMDGNNPANVATIDGEIVVVDASGQLPGDLNGNGELDMDDVLRALKMSVDLIPVNLAADIDKDGSVTAADARFIRERVLGKAGIR